MSDTLIELHHGSTFNFCHSWNPLPVLGLTPRPSSIGWHFHLLTSHGATRRSCSTTSNVPSLSFFPSCTSTTPIPSMLDPRLSIESMPWLYSPKFRSPLPDTHFAVTMSKTPHPSPPPYKHTVLGSWSSNSSLLALPGLSLEPLGTASTPSANPKRSLLPPFGSQQVKFKDTL